MKDLIVLAYTIYLPIVIILTLYVANKLFKNSIVYMNDIFNGRAEIAKATNTLFKIGFYLMNLGFALFILRIAGKLSSTQETIEALSMKIGGFSIYLGGMLFLTCICFLEERGQQNKSELLRN